MGDWLHPVIRFAHYSLLLGLFGLTAFRTIGLRSLAASGTLPNGSLIIVVAIAAPLVSLALMLVEIAAMMGQPVSQLEWSMIAAMIGGTEFGWAFLARLALLVAAALLLGISARRSRRWPGAALLYALALASMPFSGHAAATEGAAGLLHRLADTLHLFAAGLWIGAIGWFLYLVSVAHRSPSRVDAAPLLAVMHRFVPFGATLVAIVAISGVINTTLVIKPTSLWNVLGALYGWLLTAKVAVVGLMLLCALRNAMLGSKAAVPSMISDRQALLGALRYSLATELGLAAIVISLVAVLGLTSPTP